MRISFISFFYFLVTAITIFLYLSVFISPSVHWIFGIISLLIPLFILINFCMLVFSLIRRNWNRFFITLVTIALGYKFIAATFNFSSPSEKTDFKLLTYNVRVFNNYTHLRDPHYKICKDLIGWTSNHNADIKCFQEFYHNKGMEIFRTIDKHKKKTPYYYFEPYLEVQNQFFGLAIFSKHPIVNKGELKFQKGTFNQAIYADIKIKNDTIRVYNVHLQSMSIDEEKIPLVDANFIESSKYLLKKFKKGSVLRAAQIKKLIDHIKTCPYKIVLAGDLNEVPYSHAYYVIGKDLNNAFEKKGRGLGFTYNGKLFFLRIDNVFSDERLKVENFKTRNDVKYTDHFPLEAGISFKE